MSLQKIASLMVILFTLTVLTSCDLVNLTKPVPGIDDPLVTGDGQFTVVEARVKTNYAVHYIMHYPEDTYTFYAITAIIGGAGEPQTKLSWGRENLDLIANGVSQELVYATWTITGDDILYQSGQEFDYRFIFIYQVPVDSDYTAYALVLKDGQQIEISAILEMPEGPEPASKSEDGSGEDEEVKAPQGSGGEFAVIGGGSDNNSTAFHTTVGGGYLNTASVAYGTVGGGRENGAVNLYTTVGGGYANLASGRDATIGGGGSNTASQYHATVGGGIRNQAIASDTTISGGSYNQAGDLYAVVGGGTRNAASSEGSVVSGGSGNTASGYQSTVSGGLGNLAGGDYAVVAGGSSNTASGAYSITPGGSSNQALADFSVALGRRSVVRTGHSGTTLVADALDLDFNSVAPNEFGVRASGGVRFVTAVDQAGDPLSGVSLPAGSGAWATLSDRNMKENFRQVNELDILALVADLPISEWNYSTQEPGIRHIGPVAQDFYAAFGTGDSDHHINTVDADGVALASIQGLYRLVEEKEDQIQTLETRLTLLENRYWFTAFLVLTIGGFSILRKKPGSVLFKLFSSNRLN